MILAVRDLPGVEIIPTRALNHCFALETGPITWVDARQLAQATVDNETIRADNRLASPAETLDVIARAMLRLVDGGPRPTHLPLRRVLGPVEPPPTLDRPLTVNAEVGLAVWRELVHHIAETGHLPASLAVDGVLIGPGPLLRAVTIAFLELDRGLASGQMTFQPGAEEPAIATWLAEEQIYRQLPNWPPHLPDLRLDQLALHTRLQSWSLKPAVLVDWPFGSPG
jgi:hypothetical protein